MEDIVEDNHAGQGKGREKQRTAEAVPEST